MIFFVVLSISDANISINYENSKELSKNSSSYWGLGSYNTRGHPAYFAGITKVYNNNVEEVGLSSTESSNSDDNTTTLQSKIGYKCTINN
jgi:hypothetical protein